MTRETEGTQDKVGTLLRLRQGELDAAQRRLAETLAEERRCIDLEHAAREALRREEGAAAALEAGDAAVEAFAAWLPIGRRGLAAATEARDACAAEIVRARATLTLARGGVEAIRSVLEARAAAALAMDLHRQQLEADEIGLARARRAHV